MVVSEFPVGSKIIVSDQVEVYGGEAGIVESPLTEKKRQNIFLTRLRIQIALSPSRLRLEAAELLRKKLHQLLLEEAIEITDKEAIEALADRLAEASCNPSLGSAQRSALSSVLDSSLHALDKIRNGSPNEVAGEVSNLFKGAAGVAYAFSQLYRGLNEMELFCTAIGFTGCFSLISFLTSTAMFGGSANDKLTRLISEAVNEIKDHVDQRFHDFYVSRAMGELQAMNSDAVKLHCIMRDIVLQDKVLDGKYGSASERQCLAWKMCSIFTQCLVLLIYCQTKRGW